MKTLLMVWNVSPFYCYKMLFRAFNFLSETFCLFFSFQSFRKLRLLQRSVSRLWVSSVSSWNWSTFLSTTLLLAHKLRSPKGTNWFACFACLLCAVLSDYVCTKWLTSNKLFAGQYCRWWKYFYVFFLFLNVLGFELTGWCLFV